MTDAVRWANDQLLVGTFVLPAPDAPTGNQVLFDFVRRLLHADLVALVAALGLPHHGLVSTAALANVVGGELQLRWYQFRGSVPEVVARNHEARLREYERLVTNYAEGRIMPKTKAKKEPAAPRAKKVPAAGRAPSVYTILRSKVDDSPFGKKAADPKVTSHVPLVAQVLLTKPEKAWTLDELAAAVKATGRYSIKADKLDLTTCVRSDLRVLYNQGLVRVADAEK